MLRPGLLLSVPMSALPILIADDQKDVLDALRLLLKGEGFSCVPVQSPDAAIAALGTGTFGAVVLDLNYTRDTTSGAEGMELLGKIRQLDPELPAIVMTAWGTVDLAVQAMRLGANDFIEKPWDNYRMMTILRNQLALGEAKRKSKKLERENEILRGDDAEFIAKSPSMKQVLEIVTRVAPSDANVLLTGENGTGKSMLAQFIHQRSGRSNKAFVKVNMGAIPETLFESEMFGHVRGAFTDAKGDRIGRFELAEGGSLFLDEVANMTLGQQGKLLRVLEEREFEKVGSSRTQKANVRLVSATNAELDRAVNGGSFRQDLLFRINTVEICLPPLRERREDIVPMAESYLRAHARRYGKLGIGIAQSAIDAMLGYRWPGNVRELNHVLERAVLLCNDSHISATDLQLQPGQNTKAASTGALPAQLEAMTLEDAEQLMVRQAMDRFSGNIMQAAEHLGLSRSALYRRLEKFGMSPGGDEPSSSAARDRVNDEPSSSAARDRATDEPAE
jgi:DNA-binding NtrC family response regulator